MLCCFRTCFNNQGDPDSVSVKTPLLSAFSNGTSSTIKRQPSSARPQRRHHLNANNDTLRKVNIQATQVHDVDKRLQDHGELFNDYYEKYLSLGQYLLELTEAFYEDNPEKSLNSTFLVIYANTNGKINLQRKHKYCMQITYNPDHRIDSLTISIMKTFNDTNQLIKEIIDKGPRLKNTVNLVLKDEREFRRDVLAASLGVDGPDCMKNCIEGITELKNIPKFIDEIIAETKGVFETLLKAAKNMCQEVKSNNKNGNNNMSQLNRNILDAEVDTDTASFG